MRETYSNLRQKQFSRKKYEYDFPTRFIKKFSLRQMKHISAGTRTGPTTLYHPTEGSYFGLVTNFDILYSKGFHILAPYKCLQQQRSFVETSSTTPLMVC